MPEIDWDKKSYTFDPTQISSIIYGDQLIEDSFPSDYSYTGASGFEAERVPFQILVYENNAHVNLEESATREGKSDGDSKTRRKN